MSKFKFAVLISGNGSNLGSMIEHVDNNKIKGNICCVFSNNPVAHGIERAKNAGLAYEVLDHREFKERDDFDLALVKKLEKYDWFAQGRLIQKDDRAYLDGKEIILKY